MIEVITLSDMKGADRIGTCLSCGTYSDEDREMVRICVGMRHTIGGYQGATICLCKKCKNVLKEML